MANVISALKRLYATQTTECSLREMRNIPEKFDEQLKDENKALLCPNYISAKEFDNTVKDLKAIKKEIEDKIGNGKNRERGKIAKLLKNFKFWAKQLIEANEKFENDVVKNIKLAYIMSIIASSTFGELRLNRDGYKIETSKIDQDYIQLSRLVEDAKARSEASKQNQQNQPIDYGAFGYIVNSINPSWNIEFTLDACFCLICASMYI